MKKLRQTAGSSSPVALPSPESDSADRPVGPTAPRSCPSAPPAQTSAPRPISPPPPALARLTILPWSLHCSSGHRHKHIFKRLAMTAELSDREARQHHFAQQRDFAR